MKLNLLCVQKNSLLINTKLNICAAVFELILAKDKKKKKAPH